MITTCSDCGKLYTAGSEEQACEPARFCPGCWASRKKSSSESARADADLLQTLRDIDAHFTDHFGEHVWTTSTIGDKTRAAIAKATGGAR